MRVITAQLAGGDNNADRVLVTDNAILVLDGATAFEPVPVDPGEYAEVLGHEVSRRLTFDPDGPLSDAVAKGIKAAAQGLSLRPGRSPSSTISILRVRDNLVDLYALGDSPIYYGTGSTIQVLTDERLANLGKTRLAPLVNALRAGHGYTREHQQTLTELQRAQRQLRNTADGYWIAEADPAAAHQAITQTVKSSEAKWAVLGTDGATNHIDMTAPDSWPSIATYDQQQLDSLLSRIHHWEYDSDPEGRLRPRAKRHDDKTLVAVRQVASPTGRAADSTTPGS